MFGSLYRELSKLGFTPREVDEMEVWECAVLLGVGDEEEEVEMSQRDILQARVAASEQGIDAPTWSDLVRIHRELMK